MGAAAKLHEARIERALKRAKRRDAARRKTEPYRKAAYYERLRRRSQA